MKIVKNYFYNLSYQIINIILPIITVPYVSRTLGKTNLGNNSFSQTFAQYFVLIGMLGIAFYGNREIARHGEDKAIRTKKFIEIYMLQVITCLFAMASYLIIVYTFFKGDITIYLLQSLYILGALFDISWFFMGMEQFKKTVSRNVLVKIVGVVLIFLLVKEKGDLLLYVSILSGSFLLGQIFMWTYLPSQLDKKEILPGIKTAAKSRAFLKHLRLTIVLFIPQVSVQVYTQIDKTILGLISGESELGLYDNALKIRTMLTTIVGSLGTVMLPRISNELSKGNDEKVNYYLKNSLNFMLFLAIPIVFGIIGIADNFAPWFFGKDFDGIAILLQILSLSILLIAISNVIGIQYLIPAGKNKVYLFSVTCAAVIDIILNLLLVPLFASIGTAIAAVCAELVVVLVQVKFSKEKLFIFRNKDFLKYFIAGAGMFVVVYLLGTRLSPTIPSTFIQVACGGLAYIGLCFVLRVDLIIGNLGILKKRFLK